jgi:tape measure domain-containing protein
MGAPPVKVEIVGDATHLLAALKQSSAGLTNFTSGVSATAKQSSVAFQGLFSTVAGGVTVGNLLSSSIQAARAAVSALVRDVAETTLAFDSLKRTMNFGTGDGARGMATARRIADEYGLSLTAVTSSYAKFAAASRGTAIEGAKTEAIFRAVSGAAAVMGLSTEQTEGAFLALGQMVSKGTVQAEELRGQLGERLPGAFQIAARGMGMTTRELGKALEQGKVLAEDFLPKFAAQLQKELGKDLPEAMQSPQASINRLKSGWTELMATVGNSGPLAEAGKIARELADALGRSSKTGLAQQLGSDLTSAISAARSLAVLVWDLRGGILALAKAFGLVLAMRVGSWAGEWISNLKTKIDITLAARMHTIAMARGDVDAAAAAVVNANATLVKSRALAVSNGNTFAAAAVSKMLTAQEAVLTQATTAHTAALARLNAAQSLGSVAGAGLRSVVTALGGPVGILSGLVMLGAWAWSSWTESAKKAREEAQRLAAANGDIAVSAAGLVVSLRQATAELAKAKPGSKEAVDAARMIASTENEIIALGPKYRDVMKDKAKSVKDLADQVERLARADAASVQTQIDALEKRKSSVVGMNSTIQKAGGWATIDVERNNATRTRGSLKAEFDEIEQQLTALYTKRGAYLNALNTAGASPKTPASPAAKGGSDNVYQTEMNRLRAEGLAIQEQTTLAQKQAVEEGKAALDLEETRQRIAKALAAKDPSLTPGQAQDLRAQAEAQYEARMIALAKKFSDERVKIDQETQNKLETLEEHGYARKAAGMIQAFQKANEERQKAGLKDLVTEGLYQNLAALKAREVESEVGKLRAGLAELEKEKGRALSFDEQMESLDELAKKLGVQLPESVAAFRVELAKLDARGKDGKGGFLAGLKEALAQTSNTFAQWKQAAMSVVSGVTNAFSTGIAGILSGQMTLAEGLRAIWQGILNTIIQTLAQLAAQYMVSALVRKVIQKLEIVGDLAGMTGAMGLATAETWAAYAGIPFIGPGLALSQIGMMNGLMAPVFASVIGATAFAQGGLITKPTLGLLAEAGQNELAVPEVTFLGWAENLTRNLLRQERQVQGYQQQSMSYATRAKAGPARQGAAPIHVHLRGATILDSSQRGLRKLGGMVIDGARAKAREVGVVLVPGAIFGGI